MYLEMETPLEVIQQYIKNLVLQEVNNEGLLSDVQSTKTLFKDLTITEVPSIWIYLGNWNIEEETINKNNSRATLVYEVEISVICNLPELEDSDVQATSIQSRIVESIIKNWKRLIHKEMNIQNPGINIETGYDDGRLRVANKQTRVVIKGILTRFRFTLDWIRCIKEQNNIITDNAEQNNDETNNNGG